MNRRRMVRLAYLLFTRLTSLISLGPPRLESSASLEKMKIYPGATALNFIFGALLLLYLPLQIRTRNIGLSFFILWVSALCFAYGANTVVWRDNALNSSPVWCEICMFALPPSHLGCTLVCRTYGVVSSYPCKCRCVCRDRVVFLVCCTLTVLYRITSKSSHIPKAGTNTPHNLISNSK